MASREPSKSISDTPEPKDDSFTRTLNAHSRFLIRVYNLSQSILAPSCVALLFLLLTSLTALLTTSTSIGETAWIFLPMDFLFAIIVISLYGIIFQVKQFAGTVWKRQTPPYDFPRQEFTVGGVLKTIVLLYGPPEPQRKVYEKPDFEQVWMVLLIQMVMAFGFLILFSLLHSLSPELAPLVSEYSSFISAFLALTSGHVSVVAVGLFSFFSNDGLTYVLILVIIPTLLFTPIARTLSICIHYTFQEFAVDDGSIRPYQTYFQSIFGAILLGVVLISLYRIYSPLIL